MRNMRLPSAYSLAKKSEHQASLGTYSLIVAVLRLYFLTGLCCQVTSSIVDWCTLVASSNNLTIAIMSLSPNPLLHASSSDLAWRTLSARILKILDSSIMQRLTQFSRMLSMDYGRAAMEKVSSCSFPFLSPPFDVRYIRACTSFQKSGHVQRRSV